MISEQALGTHTKILWVLGRLSLQGKWQRHETDNSSSSSAEVKNGGVIPPLPACLLSVVYIQWLQSIDTVVLELNQLHIMP
jgi:hypothetical protein